MTKQNFTLEQAVKEQVAQALQRMLLASQRRGTALSEIAGLDPAAQEALVAAGFETVGEVLDADVGEDAEATARLDEALPDEDAREELLEALRAFESAPADEPEEDEDDFLSSDDEPSDETEEPEETEDAGEAGSDDETEAASEPGENGPDTENPEK